MSDNTASNLGTGQGVFAQKVGDDLQFKSLLAGTNITLSADSNNITITASNDTTALNLGIGSGLFTSKQGDNLQLRSIIANADSGISVTQNSNDLTFQLVSANVDAGKLGGVAASDFLRKSDNLASVASVATARTNLSVYSKAEIDANVIRNNTNVLPTQDSTWSLGSNSYKWANIYADNFYGRASVAGAIDSIANIGDIDTSGAVNGSVLKYNSSSGNWEVGTDLSGGGGGGSATFLGLTDTPSNFTGDAGKFIRVNSGETALEFTNDVATTTYVDTQVANLVASAPAALDTLNELAAALGDDANFSTTVTNSIATKLATADFTSTANTWLATKSTTDVAEGTNLYYTDARVDTHLNQSNPTAGYVLSWNGSDYAWVAPASGSGDITSVVAGTGLTGGATSGDATLNVDVGTGANQIVQLDGSGRLPAVDGSQLTGVSTATTISALTDTTIGTAANGEVLFYNGSAWVDQALTTDNVSEGANLYYTDTRADARVDAGFTAKSTTDLAEGSNLYYTDTRADARVNLQTGANLDLSSKSTTDLAEGSNLYFTNARADARVQAASLTDLSNVDAVTAGEDGYVLYYDHSTTSFKWKVDATGGSYGDSDVSALLNGNVDTHIIPDTDITYDLGSATKRFRALYLSGATINLDGTALEKSGTGKLLWDSNDVQDYNNLSNTPNLSVYQTTANLNSDIDAHLNQSNPTSGYVLSWNGSDYAWVANGTGGITDIVNDTSPQLGGTLDANGNTIDMGTNVITDAKVGQWDTAYGWGDHSTAGYLTTETNDLSSAVTWANVPDANITQSSVTQHQAALTITESQISDLGTYQTVAGLNAAVDSHLNQSNPTAGYVLSWNGSDYAWTDNTGYTSFNTDFDTRLATKDTDDVAEGSTNLYYTDTRADARITAAGSANWNTAYGWGDHSTAGYLTSVPAQSFASLTGKPTTIAGYGITDLNASIDTHLNQSNPTAGYVLSWNGSDYAWIDNTGYTSFNTDFDTRLATKSTTDLAEGTNLYYTDARADARVNLQTGANLDLSSKSTTNLAEGSNLYYTDTRVDSRITGNWLVDEDNMASDSATKIPSQQSVKAYVDAQVATANELGEMTDVTLTSLANNQFLKYNSSTSQWENATVTASTAAGSNTQVQFNDGGVMGSDADLTYNKTSNTLSVVNIDMGTNTFNDTNVGNWNTAYGWGDHSTAGYLTAETNDLSSAVTWANVPDANITQSSVTQHQSALTITESQISDLQSYLTAETSHADVVVDGDFASQGIMLRGASAGSYSILTDNSANWNTAYGWGDHASAGYQTTASLNGDIDAHLNQSNPTSGYVLSWNGSDYAWVAQSSGGGSVAGSDTHVQFNDGGSFGGDAGFTYNKTTDALTVGSVTTTGSSPSLQAAGNLAISTTASNGNITITPHNTGDIILDGQKWPQADGSANQYLKTDGAGQLSWDSLTTDDVAEGSNEYFTNARADARIAAADLADLSNVHTAAPTDGQVLTWDNANSYWKPATASGGGGSGGTEYEEFKINYATNGNITSISNTSSGISSVNITSATGGTLTVNFTGYTTPPLSIMMYGYNYGSNEYNMNTLGSTGMTTRSIPGGGSSGSPTAFGSFASINLVCREAETGASRQGFPPSATHAWVRFVMGA